ncbi:Cerato-platanin [Suillus lakei]|nr:Cerato-platanin [Suillus lakei]
MTYDDASLALASIACSDGTNGLQTKGYTTFGSLPTFPNVGGVYTITEYNYAACGTCYNVTYGSNTVAILTVDVSKAGFDVSETAMNTLTGNLAVELGKVDAPVCGL